MKAQDRVTWRGVKMTARQRDALRWAQRKFRKRYPGVKIIPTQGSWSTSVPASAGTHSGAGAVDLTVKHLTRSQRIYMVRCVKQAGQAAWYRYPAQGFDPHIHVLDKVTRNMAPGGCWQVTQYNAGRTGLSSNKADKTYRPKPPVKWSWAKHAPVTA